MEDSLRLSVGEYEIRLCDYADPAMMRKLLELQNVVYAGQHTFTEATFKFWYLDNPLGTVISFNAWKDGEMVAHYACIPVQMKIGGRVVRGLLDMATVTHPQHRGKGLFKTLAKTTYDYASQQGYEFVVGVANDNSYPGYIKYFPFTDVGSLEVKIGIGRNIQQNGDKTFSGYWDADAFAWRASRERYSYFKNSLYCRLAKGPFKNFPLVKIFMGHFGAKELECAKTVKCRNPWTKPFTLYIGLGADFKGKPFVKAPKFLHPSEFHLIFLDLTDGKLPKMTRNNVFYQLVDFDVV